MIRYILLILVWLVLLYIVLDTYCYKHEIPNLWILIGLFITSIIPIFERLKLGDWFELTKKVGSLDKDLKKVSGRLDILMNSMQSQQQYNIALPTEEVARSFAEAIKPTQKVEYPSESIEKTRKKSAEEKLPEKLTDTDWGMMSFISAADKAISTVTPLLKILHIALLAKKEKNIGVLKASEHYSKNIESLIEELPGLVGDVYGTTGDLPVSTIKYLKNIKPLIEIREKVYKGDIDPPSIKEGGKIISDVYGTVAYVSGALSALSVGGIAPELARGQSLNNSS